MTNRSLHPHPKALTLSVLLALTITRGEAQSPAAADKDPARADRLESVTVTAQRREQELQQVPLPVSSFAPTELELRGIINTLRVADFVPNTFASNNTGLGTANQYFIRALGNTESIATFDPPVGTYVNDVYVSRQNANNFGFYDVERIEVLRGPQGTLFGRNTTGGAINVILKKPARKLGGYFEVGGGRFGEVTSRGSVDVPMSEAFRTKFSYYFKRDDGYADNVTTGEKVNQMDMTGVRAAFVWTPSTRVTWDFSVDHSLDEGTNLFNARDGSRRIVRTGLRSDSPGFFTPAGVARLTGAKNGFGLGNEVKNTAVTSNVILNLDALSMEFITGWRDLKQQYALDFGNSPVPSGGFTIANDGRHKQFSQEVKAVGDVTGSPLSYVAGIYYLDEDNKTDFGDIFNTVFSGAPQPGTTLVLADRVLKNTVKSTALYGQADYKVSKRLTATVGLRYTSETKRISFSDNRASAAPTALLNDSNIAAAGIPLSQDTRLSTPRFALSFQMNPDTMLFASATRGFKSGGWNARGTNAVTLQPFLPEKVWSYEGGWRMNLAGNSVRFNGTLFHMDVEQLQTPAAFVAPSGAVSFITRNFADLRNQGLELEFTATPARGLTTYLTAGFQNAKYVNVAQSIIDQQATCRQQIAAGAASRPACLNGIVTASGNLAIPVRAPKQNATLGATYAFPLGWQALRMSASLNAAYTSRVSVQTAEAAFGAAHTVVNASLALLGPADRWKLALDCSNCSDKSWVVSSLAGLNYINEPRRWALRLNHTFK
jgi:iron complex outermembrane receptor protein